MTNSDIDGPGRVRILAEADPATFELLDGENMSTVYQRDHTHIFSLGQVMEGADVNSFRLLPLGGSFDAQDAAHHYWQGAVVG